MENFASLKAPCSSDDSLARLARLAELVALCFHAGKFTPAKAATWLAERGFTPLLVVPNAGRQRYRNFISH